MRRGPKRKQWRLNVDPDDGFDELSLAGGLVHLEMMSATWLWVKVGSQMCNINLRTKLQTPWERY